MKRKKIFSDDDEKNLNKRLNILSQYEYNQYYSLPVFESTERDKIFEFDEEESFYIESLKSINSKISAMLQITYFKVKRRFFNIECNNSTIKTDITYIINKFFKNKTSFKDIVFYDTTLSRQRKEILKIFNYNENDNFIDAISNKVSEIVVIDTTPKYIFQEIWRYCYLNSIILPSYKDLQLIISKNIINEEKRLMSLLEGELEIETINNLKSLLNKDNGRYLISSIRQPTKELSYTEASEELDKYKTLKPIFLKSKDLFQNLKISNNTIKYFANLLENFDIHDLKKLKQNKQYFILLCFCHYKYMITVDTLVYTFMEILDKKIKKAEDNTKEIIRLKNSENYNEYKNLSRLLKLLVKESKPEKTEDFIFEAFSIISEKKIINLIKYLEKTYDDDNEILWMELDKQYESIKKNLRYIFRCLDFSQSSSDKFNEAVKFLKEDFIDKNKDYADAPIDFVPKKQQKYLYQSREVTVRKEINPKRYEIFVYKTLQDKIKSEDIILKDSLNYKILEDYLINEDEFNNNYEKIIKSLSLDRIENFEDYLDYNCELLEYYLKKTNENIVYDRNKFFSKEDSVFSPKYETFNEPEKSDVFSKLPVIHLTEVLKIVNQNVDFLSSFVHISNKFDTNINENILLAVLFSNGTNFGTKRMSASSAFSIAKLRGINNDFFIDVNLRKSNQKINNKAYELKTFKYYNISENNIHSSSDGQRFPTSGNIFKSKHSKKFFGKGKGLSNITLNSNYQPLELKVVSSGEYEGYSTLELLLMNQSNIKPTIHSTDTHGLTDVNFVLMALSGFDFAPKIANTQDKLAKIVSTKPINTYPENWIIKPNRMINKELILSEKKKIIRVIVSLVSKTGTVSTIVKKLCNSKKKRNRLMKALSEYDKLIRTIHILKFIDSPEYRKEITVSLNRGEEYHNLFRAVKFGNLGKIKNKSETKQLIYEQCTKLICSAIIYYNSYILSILIEEKEKLSQFDEIEKLKKVSPISWQHINFFGKYDFEKVDFNKDNFEKEIKEKILFS